MGKTIDPADVDATTGMGVVGPDYWRFAQVKDWILLCRDIPHVDVRVYGIFRTLATQWLNNRRLTKDQVRWMCPGVNGKPMGERTFDAVLRRLGERGLVTIERDTVHVRTERNVSTGRYESVESLLFRVNELPEEGTDYEGWHNVADALDSYPGPGWDQAEKVPQKSAQQSTRPDQPKRDVSAGHTGRRSRKKSAPRPQKSAEPRKKSARDTRDDQGKLAPPYLPSIRSSKPASPAPSTEPPSEPQAVGEIWLAGSDLGDGARRSEGARLLGDLPTSPPLPSSVIAQCTPHVDTLLASGWTERDLQSELLANLPGTYGPGLIVKRVQDLRPKQHQQPRSQSKRLPACTQCGARDGEPASVRMVTNPDTGRAARCGCVPQPAATVV